MHEVKRQLQLICNSPQLVGWTFNYIYTNSIQSDKQQLCILILISIGMNSNYNIQQYQYTQYSKH